MPKKMKEKEKKLKIESGKQIPIWIKNQNPNKLGIFTWKSTKTKQLNCFPHLVAFKEA